MRRLFNLVAGQNVLHQFRDLVRHVGDEPVEPVKLASLIEDDRIQFINGVERMSEIDLELLDSGFFVVRHWCLLRRPGASGFFRHPPDVCRGRYIAAAAKHQLSLSVDCEFAPDLVFEGLGIALP